MQRQPADVHGRHDIWMMAGIPRRDIARYPVATAFGPSPHTSATWVI